MEGGTDEVPDLTVMGREGSESITAAEPVWYFPAVAIVAGHVLAVVLAHDRALADFGRDAVRS